MIIEKSNEEDEKDKYLHGFSVNPARKTILDENRALISHYLKKLEKKAVQAITSHISFHRLKGKNSSKILLKHYK